MPPTLDAPAYRNLLESFLAEDIGAGDITTQTTVPANNRANGELIAKAPMILAGIELFAEVFRILDPTSMAAIYSLDGESLMPGKLPACVNASARALLTGERVALNLLQRLCGVATLTRRFVHAIEGTGAAILDTRKTTPGLRAFEKYAVLVGGGKSHRKDLSEAVLIKENHIRLAGGVSAALSAAQAAKGRVAWIEIEVTNLDELRAALPHHPNVILLDNMSPSLVRCAVAVSYTHLRAHETGRNLVCRLLLEKKKKK